MQPFSSGTPLTTREAALLNSFASHFGIEESKQTVWHVLECIAAALSLQCDSKGIIVERGVGGTAKDEFFSRTRAPRRQRGTDCRDGAGDHQPSKQRREGYWSTEAVVQGVSSNVATDERASPQGCRTAATAEPEAGEDDTRRPMLSPAAQGGRGERSRAAVVGEEAAGEVAGEAMVEGGLKDVGGCKSYADGHLSNSGMEEFMHDNGTLYLQQFKAVTMLDTRPAGEVVDGHDIARHGDSEGLMQWLLEPCTLQQFSSDIYERRPLLVQRVANRSYFDGWLSKADVDKLLHTRQLRYGLNVDVTSYTSGQRKNHNYNGDAPASTDERGTMRRHHEDGFDPYLASTVSEQQLQGAEPEVAEVADPEVVWQRHREGCSVRLLHPQRWCDQLWNMLSVLEGVFHCVVGCNIYLTPAGYQGFGPHYDDIDAFILQTEGSKRWRLYPPASPEEALPRYSSPDFLQEDLGEPILDVVLQPGDLLYMPRGTIHQADSPPDTHSLHITISANQLRSWQDFLERLLPRALQLAGDECLTLRSSLPTNAFLCMGVVHSDREDNPNRAHFMQLTDRLVKLALEYLPLDRGIDELAVQFLCSRLPPAVLPARPAPKDVSSPGPPQLDPDNVQPDTLFQVVDPLAARLVSEGDLLLVYHCLGNPRQDHAAADEAGGSTGTPGTAGDDSGDAAAAAGSDEEAGPGGGGPIELPLECAPLVEALLMSSNEPVAMKDLPPVEDCDDVTVMDVLQVLVEAGLLLVL